MEIVSPWPSSAWCALFQCFNQTQHLQQLLHSRLPSFKLRLLWKKTFFLWGAITPPPSLRLCQCKTTSVDTFIKHFLSLVQHYASRWPLMKSLYAQCNMHPFRGTEITSWCRGLPKTSSLYSPRFSFFRPMCAFIISSSRNNPTNSQTIYRPRQFAGNSGLALQSFTCWFNHKGNGLINDISL